MLGRSGPGEGRRPPAAVCRLSRVTGPLRRMKTALRAERVDGCALHFTSVSDRCRRRSHSLALSWRWAAGKPPPTLIGWVFFSRTVNPGRVVSLGESDNMVEPIDSAASLITDSVAKVFVSSSQNTAKVRIMRVFFVCDGGAVFAATGMLGQRIVEIRVPPSVRGDVIMCHPRLDILKAPVHLRVNKTIITDIGQHQPGWMSDLLRLYGEHHQY